MIPLQLFKAIFCPQCKLTRGIAVELPCNHITVELWNVDHDDPMHMWIVASQWTIFMIIFSKLLLGTIGTLQGSLG